MNIMRDSVMEINAGLNDTTRVKVVVREVWVEVENGKVTPWVSTITKDEIKFPFTFRLTPENISARNIIFLD